MLEINRQDLVKKTGIYKITNLVNNKCYIGSTGSCLYDRLRSHISLLKRGIHENNHLQKAFNKYGEENFNIEILEFNNIIGEILTNEEYYIELYRSYNPDFGYNIYRFANSNKGNKWSEEARIKRKGFGKGKKRSNETKHKQRMAKLGTTMSEAAKQKLAALPKNNRKITMLTLDGEFVREFKNAREASLYFNLAPSTYVCHVLSGKRKTCKGYRLILSSDYNEGIVLDKVLPGPTSAVNQYDLNGNFIQSFLSMKEAEIAIGKIGSNPGISACCKGKLKTSQGFIWKYKDK